MSPLAGDGGILRLSLFGMYSDIWWKEAKRLRSTCLDPARSHYMGEERDVNVGHDPWSSPTIVGWLYSPFAIRVINKRVTSEFSRRRRIMNRRKAIWASVRRRRAIVISGDCAALAQRHQQASTVVVVNLSVYNCEGVRRFGVFLLVVLMLLLTR